MRTYLCFVLQTFGNNSCYARILNLWGYFYKIGRFKDIEKNHEYLRNYLKSLKNSFNSIYLYVYKYKIFIYL